MQKSLEDIKLFCDEASALVRAGLPLDGIAGTSSRLSATKLKALVESIQQQTANGEPIAKIIDATRSAPDRLVTATVAAGLASGKLEHSLEMLGDVAADVRQVRQRLKSALIYPASIMVIATGLFAFFIRHFLVATAQALLTSKGSLSPVLQTLFDWDQQFWWWPIMVPLAMVLVVVVPLFCRPAGIIQLRGTEKLVKLIPGVSGVLTSLQFYHASRVLSLLIHQNVPLNTALVISGACSERTGLNAAFREAAQRLEAGELADSKIQGLWKHGQLPPLITVALKNSNCSEQRLKLSLTGVTSHYHRRLETGMTILRQYVPIGLTIFVAGTTVLLYSVAVFWPMVELYANIIQEGDLGTQ
ncbi:MAG: type II secretion system F family protein [Fuerstiella sp.]